MITIKNKFKKYLSDIVYGANDGIVTTFAVVAGFNGANLDLTSEKSYTVILLFGLANLFGDAVSMGMGSFLSTRAKQDLSKSDVAKNRPMAVAHGLATTFAFIFFGIIPILPVILRVPRDISFQFSILLVFIALATVGYLRWLVTGKDKLTSISETVMVGGVSSFVAYFVGLLFRA